ncbi:MAG: hypothetical protein IPL28_22760 [Chloroflexi bacterium]|nr:hypothetical protein [Chloroflexota bacterium]
MRLVSHSGSRAVGFTIANWYTKVAEQYAFSAQGVTAAGVAGVPNLGR